MINGSQNPIVGTDEIYTLVNYSLGLAYLDTNPQYTWHIKRLYGEKWIDITKEPQKTGLSVPFNFGPHVVGEKFLLEVYKETKNIFTQKNETHKMGELQVIPASGKVPKITKVVLFNRGARDVNKASYTDKLVARAYCVGMFNKTINFHLWEDDAAGGGHNAEINKNNRINKSYPARVNVNGIAEAEISLSADQNVMKQVANRFMMHGDTNEGAFHEFYVTASYDHKILGANQTNVDVANPDYKKPQPKSSTPQKTNIPSPKQPQQEESLMAKSINFIVDNVINVFTPEKTKTATNIGKTETPQQNGTCPRCTNEFTYVELKEVFKNAEKKDLEELLISLNEYRAKFSLNTCAKKAHFFAQCIEESGRDLKGALVGEGLQYPPEQLVIQFDNFRSKHVKGSKMENTIYMGHNGERLSYADRKQSKPTPEAYKYGKTNNHEANEKMIATIAYGNRNGNKTPEDAWNFRGRGLLQITGKGNYSLIQGKIDEIAPQSKVNVFEEVPEQGYTPHKAAITGMAEWVLKSLNTIALNATKDNDDSIVNQIVDKLNDATSSRAKRIVHYRGGTANAKNSPKYTAEKDKNGNPKYKPTKEIFKVGECILLTGEKKEQQPKNGKRAPWMEVAIVEAKSYGGKKEWLIDERIKKYHEEGGSLKAGSDTAWCASFVCWCIEKKDYKTPHSAGSRMFLTSSNAEKCDVFYGAVAVFSDCDESGTKIQTTGHATFILGKLSDGRYVCLGGNQGDMLKVSPYDCSGNVFVSWTTKKGIKHYKVFRGFYKPKGYTIQDDDQLKSTDNYSNADQASNVILKLNIKSSSDGESSR